MNDKYICSGDKLTNIGDAIRAKTGSSDKLTLDGMASAINNIENNKDVLYSIIAGNDTTSVITDIDYKENLNCAILPFPLSTTSDTIYYPTSGGVRFVHSAIISDNYNYLNMCYLKAGTSPVAYIDHYNNQMSLSNNENKVQINSTTYVFSSEFRYVCIMWSNDIVNIEQISNITKSIQSEYEYKENSNFAIIPFGDYNENNIYYSTIIGGNITSNSFITKMSTSISSLYYGEMKACWSFTSPCVSSDFISHYVIENNNGKTNIKLISKGNEQTILNNTANYLLLIW